MTVLELLEKVAKKGFEVRLWSNDRHGDRVTVDLRKKRPDGQVFQLSKSLSLMYFNRMQFPDDTFMLFISDLFEQYDRHDGDLYV